MFFFLILYQGLMSRLAGSGFGAKWNAPYLPEILFSAPFGLALAHVVAPFLGFWPSFIIGALAIAWSYAFMQSGTWMFLRWESHDNPNTKRGATLKPIIDFIAGKLGYNLGDEGYSWVAASVKGFLIGLPVGGLPLAVLWPLGYEIGSHAEGRVEKYGIEPHAVSEVAAGLGGAISIVLFLMIF